MVEQQNTHGGKDSHGQNNKLTKTTTLTQSNVYNIINLGKGVPRLTYYVNGEYFSKEKEELLKLLLHTARGKISFFDEFCILASNENYRPILVYSYRDNSQGEIKYAEYSHLLKNLGSIKDGEIISCDDAEGSNFDIIVKISDNFSLIVNNTGDSIDEIETKNPSVTWDMSFIKLKQLAGVLARELQKK